MASLRGAAEDQSCFVNASLLQFHPSGECCSRRRASIQLPLTEPQIEPRKSAPQQLQHCRRRRSSGATATASSDGGSGCPSPRTATPPPTPRQHARRGASLDAATLRRAHWSTDSCCSASSACSSSRPEAGTPLQPATAAACPPASAQAAAQPMKQRRQKPRHAMQHSDGWVIPASPLLLLQLMCSAWLAVCALALCLFLASL